MKRLIDARFPEGSAEEIAAAHLRGTAALPDISPAALARVSARLAAHARKETSERSHLHPWFHWRTATVVVLVALSIAGATAAGVRVIAPRVRALLTPRPVAAPEKPIPRAPDSRPAASGPIAGESEPAGPATATPDPSAPAAAPSEPAAPAAAARSRTPARDVAMAEPRAADDAPPPVAMETPPEPLLRLPAPSVEPPPASTPPPFVPDRPAAPTPTPTTTTRLARETELLSLALGRLRGNRDPQGALAYLDQYAVRFSRGTLAPEADITRVEALLALDRREEAAAILNRLTLPASARGRELLVVRAELGARARRWGPAITDFTRALADPALEAELVERSLHGRAACHLGNRNLAAARADLSAYLRSFPDGRFEATARATLRDLESNPR